MIHCYAELVTMIRQLTPDEHAFLAVVAPRAALEQLLGV